MARGKLLLMTGGYDHTVRFWEVQSGLCVRTLQFPDSPINMLRVSPDKRWLAVAGLPHIRLFKNDGQSNGHTHQLEGHTANVTGVQFQSDSNVVVSSCEDNTVKAWDLRRSNQPVLDLSHHFPVNSVALHPTEPMLLSGDQGGNVRVWDIRKSKCLREMVPDGETAIRTLSVAPDGSVLVAANNAGSVYVWRLCSPPPVAAPKASPPPQEPERAEEKQEEKEESERKAAAESAEAAEAEGALRETSDAPEGEGGPEGGE
ncbi:WD40-repeat-containing domain protein, partial [Baffinella frigidus]